MAAQKRLSTVVAEGDRRKSLEALRRTLAVTIEVAEPREVAALARQLTIVLEQLDALPIAGEATPLDELTSRRAARRRPAAEAQ